jgi:hypothetical protein
LHAWPQVKHAIVQNFVTKLLDSKITLIAHNFKYDLQIFEHFLSSNQEEITKSPESDLWQMQLGL